MSDTGEYSQGTTRSFTSPLQLILDELRQQGQQAEEALFLSYTADLGFLERFALGPVQAAGARLTVIGDAHMANPDPRAVLGAGIKYTSGLASCDGAFHPKLVVLAGPERATVAIGSGNATLAGWQSNSELWTVVRADGAHTPLLFRDLSTWLRRLPDVVDIAHGSGEALLCTAELLDHHTAKGAPAAKEARFVSNGDAPILDQLPVGPVDELVVSAPFHDGGARALDLLVRRLRPARFVVCYQPGHTELDGSGVEQLLRRTGGLLRADDERDRYRHGKLIEWVADGRRWALTGSPNLSCAALVHMAGSGGNCEIGVIAPVIDSLAPAGAPADASALHDVRPPQPDSDHRRTTAVLLGAVRTPQGISVQLSRKADEAVALQLSRRDSDPDELGAWQPLGEVPAGESETVFSGGGADAEGGSRIRTMGPDGPGGIVFVTDPVRTRRKPGGATRPTPATAPDDLFQDPALAEQFARSLAELRLDALAAVGAASGSGSGGSAVHESVGDHTGWQAYLDGARRGLGQPLVHFALGLPATATGTPAPEPEPVSLPAWYEDLSDADEVGLDDGGNGDDEAPTPGAVVPDLWERRDRDRRRYQLWAARLAEGAAGLDDPVRRLASLHLVICTVARGAWPMRDRSWFSVLARAITATVARDFPDPALASAGSLTAVALAVLRAEVVGGENDEERLEYERTCSAASHLLVEAQAAHIEEYARPLARAFAGAVHPESVLDLCDRVVQGDVVADAVDRLTERGRQARRRAANLLEVTGGFGTPSLAALEAVSLVDGGDLVGAWAVGPQGKWSFVIWSAPDLVEISGGSHGAPMLWRHYRLTGITTPGSLWAGGGLSGRQRVNHGPQNQPFPLAEELLAHLGLEGPEP
ncbi:hypothetical protein [Streptomyces sp. AP-93]|uniref:hypothetical protein n=1 Tax=Streptomyces sp. AP-93 TaxID=2929048 RepID=UPI001FAF23E6|nr:hypothetical protein [Streptomyces sp. AP-93]MCJ0873248.1 hypothetical protein [Streptomyces sp. AP-93]